MYPEAIKKALFISMKIDLKKVETRNIPIVKNANYLQLILRILNQTKTFDCVRNRFLIPYIENGDMKKMIKDSK